MFKPSPVLGARLRLTTKQVNGGYYKGNRTGSLGAHTQYGAYVIDYRKVRHYNVPDLSKFELTPYVTRQMEEEKLSASLPDGTLYAPGKQNVMDFILKWHMYHPTEVEQVLAHQLETLGEPPSDGDEESVEGEDHSNNGEETEADSESFHNAFREDGEERNPLRRLVEEPRRRRIPTEARSTTS